MNWGEREVPIIENPLAEAQKQWQAALGELQLQMTRATFDTWLRGSRVIAHEDNRFTVHVRHAYAVDWLQNRLLPVIQRTLRRRAGPDAQVVFTARAPEDEEQLVLVPEPGIADLESTAQKAPEVANGRPSTTLNEHYTFERFVVGSNNRLAHAASRAVAENPAHAYNPLFLYGGVGLGKTHLLHALGHEAQSRGLTVLYVSSEWFTNDLINAIREQKTEEFRAKYRHNDVLLVDDIQFIAGKDRTQDEFFHTFNSLYDSHRQIVVTSDKYPHQIPDLEERLRTRFQWGLIADIQQPELETRLAILKKKAEVEQISLKDDVALYLATNIKSNVRELEGSLIRLAAFASLSGAEITVEFAKESLKQFLSQSTTSLTIETIQKEVAAYHNVKVSDLKSAKRHKNVARPRQIAMFLCRKLTGSSFPEIGQRFGGKDHSTVISACRKIEQLMEHDLSVRTVVETLERQLQL